MPKKIKYESFKYRFLMAAHELSFQPTGGQGQPWKIFLGSLNVAYMDGAVRVSWGADTGQEVEFALGEPRFYVRGDSVPVVRKQVEAGMLNREDPVKLSNEAYFRESVARVAQFAGYLTERQVESMKSERYGKERTFHDAWAEGEDPRKIDVRNSNEACTAPEMRYITQRLGALQGKRLLDVGCGLGEASVYFALNGAEVTSSDLSPGMLTATECLAQVNGVRVMPHLAAAEDMQLTADQRFDVIYAGNLLHHVDIGETLARLKPHLAPDGMLVTWDPLAYNPVINVYRAIATEVRTPDEHPLKWGDIKTFKRHFEIVETRYFWLTTLVIFVVMAIVQRRNPNKERFWKVILQEGDKWRWLYRPLEILDGVLLNLIPPLRLLCWNVVVIARGPRPSK